MCKVRHGTAGHFRPEPSHELASEGSPLCDPVCERRCRSNGRRDRVLHRESGPL